MEERRELGTGGERLVGIRQNEGDLSERGEWKSRRWPCAVQQGLAGSTRRNGRTPLMTRDAEQRSESCVEAKNYGASISEIRESERDAYLRRFGGERRRRFGRGELIGRGGHTMRAMGRRLPWAAEDGLLRADQYWTWSSLQAESAARSRSQNQLQKRSQSGVPWSRALIGRRRDCGHFLMQDTRPLLELADKLPGRRVPAEYLRCLSPAVDMFNRG
jgi:hypothetical protein